MKSKLEGTPLSLPNLEEKIDVEHLKEKYTIENFEIANPAEVEPFFEEFEQIAVKGDQTKFFMVKVNALPSNDVDTLIHKVDSILANQGKYIMAITGSDDPIHSDYLNLAQDPPKPAPATLGPKYLSPIVLSGILIMLFIYSMFIFVTMQLMQVQTP